MSTKERVRVPEQEVPYGEREPAPALRRWVECYWFMRGRTPGTSPRRVRVLPDGCMDILVDLEAEGTGDATTSVVGTMRKPLLVEHRGAVDLVGVRFHPAGAVRFLDVATHELTDDRVELALVWKGVEETLIEALDRREDEDGRVAFLDRLLQSRLADGPEGDALALATAERLCAREPPSVAALAAELAVGRRQLERRVRAATGLPPGQLAGIARFRRTVRLLRRHPDRLLSRVALEAGFYDQSHLTRTFRALAGLTPGAFRREGA